MHTLGNTQPLPLSYTLSFNGKIMVGVLDITHLGTIQVCGGVKYSLVLVYVWVKSNVPVYIQISITQSNLDPSHF